MAILYLLGAVISFIIATIAVAYGIGLALFLIFHWQTYAVLFCLGLAYRLFHGVRHAHH